MKYFESIAWVIAVVIATTWLMTAVHIRNGSDFTQSEAVAKDRAAANKMQLASQACSKQICELKRACPPHARFEDGGKYVPFLKGLPVIPEPFSNRSIGVQNKPSPLVQPIIP